MKTSTINISDERLRELNRLVSFHQLNIDKIANTIQIENTKTNIEEVIETLIKNKLIEQNHSTQPPSETPPWPASVYQVSNESQLLNWGYEPIGKLIEVYPEFDKKHLTKWRNILISENNAGHRIATWYYSTYSELLGHMCNKDDWCVYICEGTKEALSEFMIKRK